MSMNINASMPNQASQGVGQGSRPPPPPPLSEDQKSTVQSVLEQYDASALTEEDALAITDAFKEAGIRPNAELGGLLQEAGFDPGQLAELAGIERPQGGGGPEGAGAMSPPPPPPSGSEEINTEALQALQDILNDYGDLASLTSEQQEELNSSLLASGLLNPGALIDTQT